MTHEVFHFKEKRKIYIINHDGYFNKRSNNRSKSLIQSDPKKSDRNGYGKLNIIACRSKVSAVK